MKLLVLTKKFPFPLKDGESLAIHGLTKSLSELGCEVSLLAMNTTKHFFAGTDLPAEMGHYREVRTVAVDNQISPLDAVTNLVRGTSYHISRFHQASYHQALEAWLTEEHFDIVQLETLYLAPYIRTIRLHSEAQVVMRSHNVEHEIWERCCRNISFAPKRWYLRHITRQLRDYERSQLNQYDLLLPITQRDQRNFERLGSRGRTYVLPIGLETQCGPPRYDSFAAPPNLHFIGSLDWLPNLEGLQWFLHHVWPLIHRRCPEVEFHIAGRNMPHSIRQLEMANVIVHGEVESSCEFVAAHSISIVPLLSGGGMRAKILEAMSLGRVVVTTTVGLEGITARNRRDLFIADTPEQFAQVIEECCRMGRKLEGIGRNAYASFSRHYDRRVLARELMETYHEILDSVAATP
ncbi:glycosyltransferase involved in cell wall biosynthesis [Lewinella marina]|uniref:Glycosyl transferase family 1 n=1 Tax=Neolewinella marina TaxID=438751 RepID=A0A2G0CI17_9BACT|nr:glycosyltransferase family 4 protein [Neolewinella marina]NJB85245.1 glycosyltransferase involved in cell wall biosynthesis [Neolewinella marina]PHK99623.1 glycosyl transferase family 1 [Neolewinella marina]